MCEQRVYCEGLKSIHAAAKYAGAAGDSEKVCFAGGCPKTRLRQLKKI